MGCGPGWGCSPPGLTPHSPGPGPTAQSTWPHLPSVSTRGPSPWEPEQGAGVASGSQNGPREDQVEAGVRRPPGMPLTPSFIRSGRLRRVRVLSFALNGSGGPLARVVLFPSVARPLGDMRQGPF